MVERNARLSTQLTVTIANGASQSGAFDLSEYAIAAIVTPSGWTAADLSFVASATQNGTYLPVYDDAGTEVKIASAAVVADRIIVNKAILEQLAGLRWVKLRSGAVAGAVNQGAERTFTVMLKS